MIQQTAYTHDAADRLTEVDDSVAGVITRAWDDLDRLVEEDTPQGLVTYTYDAADRRSSMTVDGQSTVLYSYDNANRLTEISQDLATVGFAYDDSSRRTTLTLANGITVDYAYDDAGQVTSLTYGLGMSTLGTLTYNYDLDGNRTFVGGTWARTNIPAAVGAATYDDANQIATWGGVAFTYDDDGNMIDDGPTTYMWNARNQLTGLSGSVSASFSYDGLGRRQTRTVASTNRSFLYDDANLVQELAGATPTANLLTGLSIDETFARTVSGGAETLLSDALGSTLALADGSGVVQTEYTYAPFGSVTSSGGTSSNSMQFTGRENDGTDLAFYRARYYHPGLGRFTSEDPIGWLGGFNLHAYVDNNPVVRRDSFGLTWETWFACWAKCIEERRQIDIAPFFSAYPKALFGLPIGLGDASSLTTPLSLLAHYVRDLAPGIAIDMRLLGRLLSQIGTPLTIAEGLYDWYIILDCAKKCYNDCGSK